MSTPSPVLVTGAGPAGMVCALWLQKFGTPFRIIDKLSGPGLTSRATAIHARTLEFYRQLGIADRIIDPGVKVERLQITNDGTKSATIDFKPHAEVSELSKYPFMLGLPQDIHEFILVEVLKERGVEVERNIELLDAVQDEAKGTVETKLKHADGTEESFTASYLIGCDGAHSIVRHLSGIQMEGGTYTQRFFVADVDIEDSTYPISKLDLGMHLSKNEYCILIPMRKAGNTRLIGFVPKDKEDLDHVSLDDVLPSVKRCVPSLEITDIHWFSAYRVHHRAANHFRNGRFFICGDAAHLHSPVGGQGMNTGIGDATNLAWKLAAVYAGKASPELLDSYEPERSGFAHQLVNTTDRAFSTLTDEGWKGWFAREFMIPYVLPSFLKMTGMSMWKTTSQINVEYKTSPLSENFVSGKGELEAGNRLAWVETADGRDNFEVLAEGKWAVHLYGEVERDVRRELQAKGFEVQKFPLGEDAAKKGLVQGVLYLVRPDGYVGAKAGAHDVEHLVKYIEKWGLQESL